MFVQERVRKNLRHASCFLKLKTTSKISISEENSYNGLLVSFHPLSSSRFFAIVCWVLHFKVFQKLNSCLICEESLFQRVQFCKHCRIQINQKLRWKFRYENGLGFWYLFDWNEKDQICSKLVRKLKQRQISFESVLYLLAFFPVSKESLKKFIIQASPAKDSNERDHAGIIASALSCKYDLKEINSIKRGPDLVEQKQKSKSERKRKVFAVLNQPPVAKPIFFVDDVVTTGATMAAARLALGEPEEFIALSLFYRNKRDLSHKVPKSLRKRSTKLASFKEK